MALIISFVGGYLFLIEGTGVMLVQLGIFILIATPIMGVFTCFVMFLWKKDFIYALLSAFILATLFYSWTGS